VAKTEGLFLSVYAVLFVQLPRVFHVFSLPSYAGSLSVVLEEKKKWCMCVCVCVCVCVNAYEY